MHKGSLPITKGSLLQLLLSYCVERTNSRFYSEDVDRERTTTSIHWQRTTLESSGLTSSCEHAIHIDFWGKVQSFLHGRKSRLSDLRVSRRSPHRQWQFWIIFILLKQHLEFLGIGWVRSFLLCRNYAAFPIAMFVQQAVITVFTNSRKPCAKNRWCFSPVSNSNRAIPLNFFKKEMYIVAFHPIEIHRAAKNDIKELAQ